MPSKQKHGCLKKMITRRVKQVLEAFNMKTRRTIFFGLALAALLGQQPDAALAQQNGGRGLTYVRSAWNLDPGYLIFYAHTRFFGKVSNVSVNNNIASAATFWDIQGGAAFNYGISRHFELAFSPIIYQDNHKPGRGYNLIDDIFLSLKVGSLGRSGGSFKYGFDVSARFPSAKKHNLPFEPYEAGKFSFGFGSRFSYALDPLYPDDGTSFHLNFGYWNHNDVGEQLSEIDPLKDLIRVTSPSQEFLYGIGAVIPSDKFDFSLELYGNAFIQRPPTTAYSRENYTYLTPKVRYKAYRWLSLDMSFDIRVSGNIDNTVYGAVPQYTGIPNYPDWRISLGTRWTLLPTTIYAANERDILMRKAETRRELFEQIIKEQRETEAAEDELERIKEERRKAERELERLRQILEGESKRKQQQKGQN